MKAERISHLGCYYTTEYYTDKAGNRWESIVMWCIEIVRSEGKQWP